MTPTIYIAGPMTGLPENNYPAFREAAQRLRQMGWNVIDPSENPPQESWEEYMEISLRQVMEADAICLLPGWEKSRGAKIEHTVAVSCAKPVLHYAPMLEGFKSLTPAWCAERREQLLWLARGRARG